MKFARIQDIAEVNPRTRGLSLRNEDPVSFVPMSAVSEHSKSIVGAEERQYIDVSKGYTYFEEGDVIVAKITPCFENGKMALASKLPHQVAFGSTEFHVFRAGAVLFNKYLFYMLQSPGVQFAGAAKMKGAAGHKRVPVEFFKALEIPVPPLDEQKRIAAILDQADELRTKRRESIDQLDALLQSTFIDMFGDPVTNPKGWEVGCIGDLMDSVNYGSSKKADSSKGRFPMLRMGNITFSGGWNFDSLKYVDLDEKEESKYLVDRGQILFNRTNSRELVGKTAVFREESPMAFAGYLVRGITGANGDAEYISAYMNLPQTKQKLQAMCKSIVGMANINAKEFQRISIPIPPIDLQRNFTKFVHESLQHKKRLESQLTELNTLFASLQSRVFKGELSKGSA